METITKNIPALALRGLTVFPRMTASFDVEREISVRALERAMETGQEIFLVTQRELGVELPEEKDLYEVGTVARVIQILRASNSMMRVVMEGGSRARLRRLWQREPFLQAQVELIGEEKSPRHGTRTEAMLRQTYALFGEYSELLPKQPESIFTTVMDATDPGFLADFIAQNSNLRYQDKQSVLEELRPLMRLRRVNEILKREISVIAMEQDIESKVRERVGQIQKDMILREQVKVLQNELGEGDSDAEFDEYRTRICACRLPEETEKKLLKDVDRLSRQPFGSAEASVLRNYLDTVLDMPWGVETKERVSVETARRRLDRDHYGLEKVKERILEFIAVRRLNPDARGQIICLVGPPGVGKTSIALSIAKAMNRKVARLSLGGVRDEADIRGHRKTYIGAMPGRIVSAIKQAFYKLACNFSIAQSSKTLQISLNGLNENLPAALRLTEEILHHAKADKTSWNQFIDLIEKQQQDAKTNQMSNFSYLWDYSTYGAYNPTRNAIKTADLRKMDPQELVNLLGGLNNIEHTVAYYGPYSEKQLNALLAKEHKTAKKLAAVPEGKEYKMEEIKQNEIYIAPYDAKNIYLRSYQNTGKKSDVKDGALISLFNEYYGGGMNTIVFQELRETRGLAYNAGAAYYTPVRKDEKDYFMRHIITQNDKMMDCIHVFDEITDNLPQNEASFNLAKQNLMKSIQSRRVTKAGVINAYFNAKLMGIDYDVTKLYYEQLPSLTLQDITNFEKQNIVGKPYRMVILGDEKNLDMKSLEKIAPIKRLSQEEIFGY